MPKKKVYNLNQSSFFKSMHNRKNKEMQKKHKNSVIAKKLNDSKAKK